MANDMGISILRSQRPCRTPVCGWLGRRWCPSGHPTGTHAAGGMVRILEFGTELASRRREHPDHVGRRFRRREAGQ